ncbi:DM13 domain-containing protein [Vibrio sp. Isolate25]|uniref:DM13 domain-containing protein n=1 Tax=Vibrio TaxID=662 RepID=UPI001EFD3B33|nr:MULTISPECIES: DM13 domain-containing protein [Vibrio]MCG9595895.1 DM13 domain-containing protein [Vibrio sp. Isolate25]MCG9677392.1 DM13 domain-containing protein [Vibrio sp. Isolate24]MCG9682173.1 DM13 domain-containing protein [Vibrio sp. Isolate23]USD35200.1 DM13 domain-containing protein [Vibrio sp. SCSIO 43186]USD48266.1 DM13 domain-containing protein [Vibrio sp. SCSIO 43145]
MKRIFLLFTHLMCGGVGFAIGIYALPILIQPDSPSMSSVENVTNNAVYTATFQRDRKDSDFLHWGEGSVSISQDKIAFVGELAPGPDYKLYLSPQFVETEADFNQQKQTMVKVGDVKTFDRFTLDLPSDVSLAEYNTVIVWCETFGEFITSARFK